MKRQTTIPIETLEFAQKYVQNIRESVKANLVKASLQKTERGGK